MEMPDSLSTEGAASEHPFIVGQVYRRRSDIHERFGGQGRGGISTPKAAPFIFLFTAESGSAYGYEDSFRPDGTFWYTGEGQVDDMQMVRGNAAIAGHRDAGKQLLLFEYTPKDRVRYVGEFEYLGHHVEQRADRNDELRNALIFQLGLVPPVVVGEGDAPTKAGQAAASLRKKKLSLADLRRLALERVPAGATVKERLTNVASRAVAIRRYALERAQGTCEACKADAPFKAKAGPFLEVHHVVRLSDGGPDHPAHVIALCPNCHRRAHYSVDAGSFNEGLIDWLAKREAS
ncbi:HNH endonuclease signature motif containing protein [Candidatus Accumulibacter sp. ACC005]|jgi:5-methylcytosine-specific restriction protein A|uniref:HNH endonuclease n=1 Tax=Candidatus Accumulibacter sp. ACC005 TaxID=2823331 RepID=UPI0025BEA23B|nr:HNH endonuclease signature motif containing protein [Candidatus Accumulibacter sp. ACC005]